MDAALAGLLPHIKEAVRLDDDQSSRLDPTKSELLAAIKDALQRDELASGEDDERIAAAAAELLPRLSETVKQEYADIRARIERDWPWALVPLGWDLDLLSPLGKGRNEVLHTQCLAYLLDHRQNHGIGIRALREFFALLGRLIPGEDIFEKLSKDTVENAERLRQVRVFAERRVDSRGERGTAVMDRRCDIWLELIEEGRSIVVVIENKIDATEHDSQLAAYEQAVWRWAQDRRQLSFDAKLIFLSPNRILPEGKDDQKLWLAVGYTELAAALVHATRDAPEPGRTYVLLYVATLLKILGVNSGAVELNALKQLPFLDAVVDHGAVP